MSRGVEQKGKHMNKRSMQENIWKINKPILNDKVKENDRERTRKGNSKQP